MGAIVIAVVTTIFDIKLKLYQLSPCVFVRDKTVLEHLSISTEHILLVECGKELGIKYHKLRVIENANLVLQSSEVNACLSAHAGIYHRQQGSRQIDEVHSALEGTGSKPAEVGHHTSTEIYQT